MCSLLNLKYHYYAGQRFTGKLPSLAQFFLNLYRNFGRSFFICLDCCYLAFVSKNFSDAEILSVGKNL